MRILRGQKGKPANMCVIQECMLAKTSNTTRLVDKLLLKELVTRNVCPENRSFNYWKRVESFGRIVTTTETASRILCK